MAEIGYIDNTGLHLYNATDATKYGDSLIGTTGMTVASVLANPKEYQDKTKLSYSWTASNFLKNIGVNTDDTITRYGIMVLAGLAIWRLAK